MPVVGQFHGHYWTATDTNVTPAVPINGQPGYPPWQAAPTMMMWTPAGIVWAGLVRVWDACAWFVRLWWASLGLPVSRRVVLIETCKALHHPCYPLAEASVRKTAVTLGFNRPEAWVELNRAVKRSPGEAENMFRHLEATRLLRVNSVLSTVSNPEANLMVELAYQGFRIHGR